MFGDSFETQPQAVHRPTYIQPGTQAAGVSTSSTNGEPGLDELDQRWVRIGSVLVSDRLVWLPFDPAELGDPPDGLRYEVVILGRTSPTRLPTWYGGT